MANGFVQLGDAFFQQSGEGLQAVSDPQTLSELRSGNREAQQQNVGGQDFASTIAQPSQQFRVPEPDSSQMSATRSAQNLIDANPETQLAQIEQRRQQRLDENRQALEQARQRRTELTEQAAGVLEDRQSNVDLIREERERLGVTEELERQQVILDEIRGLRQQAIDIEQERGEVLATTEGRKAPIGFIRGEKARVQEAYDRRLATVSKRVGAESAVLQASQGLVQQARGLVSDIVEAATFDTQMELERINLFMDDNAAQISELDTEIQRDLQRSQQHWENRLAGERQEKEQIVNLMIETPRAGISIDDSLGEAARKAAVSLNIQSVEEVAASAVEAGASQGLVDRIRSADNVGDALSEFAASGLAVTSTTDDSIELTDLQIQRGAQKSNETIETFQELPKPVQNFYVRAKSDVVGGINDLFAEVENGNITVDAASDVIQNVPGSSQEVRDYFDSLIREAAPAPSVNKPNFFQNMWGNVKNGVLSLLGGDE